MIVTQTYLSDEERTVFLIACDVALGRALRPVVNALHLRQASYPGPEDFLCDFDPERRGCILLDLSSGEADSVRLLDELSRRGSLLPVIVVASGEALGPVVRAMRAGAWNVLKRPCSEAELSAALQEALDRDAENYRRLADRLRLQRRLAKLTPGEKDVLRMLVDGQSNKSIAVALRVSVRAVEVRRSKLMGKMKAESLAELVRLTLAALPEENRRTS